MIHNKDIAKHTSWVYEIYIHSNGMVVNIEGWAPFNGSVEASGASGTILYITIKVFPNKDLPSTVFLSRAH